MDEHAFLTQHRTFAIHGYAQNPSHLPGQAGTPMVGSLDAAADNGFASIENLKGTHAERKEHKRKRGKAGDVAVVDGDNAYVGPWAAWEGDKEVPIEVEEEAEEWRAEKRRREEATEAARERLKRAAEEKSIFHGKSLTDYAGRTYMHIPTDVDVNLDPAEGTAPPESFLPKACVHTWVSGGRRSPAAVTWADAAACQTGHTKAVAAIRLFPKSGHLLLSGSMDTKVKVGRMCALTIPVLTTVPRPALGHLPRGQLLADILGPHQGHQGYLV